MCTPSEKLIILHKEIDLIQACIQRMARNSFFIKGWAISLVSAIFIILSQKAVNIVTLAIPVLIIISCFWYLDAFFLRTERTYRKMYSRILYDRKNNNFDNLYHLDPTPYYKEVPSTCKTMRSSTLAPFYGIPLAILITYIAITLLK